MSRQTRKSKRSSEEASYVSSFFLYANSSSRKSSSGKAARSKYNSKCSIDEPDYTHRCLDRFDELENIDIRGLVAQAYDELPIHPIEDTEDVCLPTLMCELILRLADKKRIFTKNEILDFVNGTIVDINNHFEDQTAGPNAFIHAVVFLEEFIRQDRLILTGANIILAFYAGMALAISHEAKGEEEIYMENIQVIFKMASHEYLNLIMIMQKTMGAKLRIVIDDFGKLLDRFLPPTNEI